MFAKKKGVSRRRHTLILAAAHVLAVCTAAAGPLVALANEPVRPTVTSTEAGAPTDLELAFWTCDYLATTYGMDATPVAFCSDVTARLQEQKFAGDFGHLLEWWRQNKPIQHGRLESAHVARASRR